MSTQPPDNHTHEGPIGWARRLRRHTETVAASLPEVHRAMARSQIIGRIGLCVSGTITVLGSRHLRRSPAGVASLALAWSQLAFEFRELRTERSVTRIAPGAIDAAASASITALAIRASRTCPAGTEWEHQAWAHNSALWAVPFTEIMGGSGATAAVVAHLPTLSLYRSTPAARLHLHGTALGASMFVIAVRLLGRLEAAAADERRRAEESHGKAAAATSAAVVINRTLRPLTDAMRDLTAEAPEPESRRPRGAVSHAAPYGTGD